MDLLFFWYIAGSVTLLQLVTANRYGYFGDEFYHMACGEHLAWGYVDQPPLIALFVWLTRLLLGTSVFSIRLLPALAGLLTVWLTGLMVLILFGVTEAELKVQEEFIPWKRGVSL